MTFVNLCRSKTIFVKLTLISFSCPFLPLFVSFFTPFRILCPFLPFFVSFFAPFRVLFYPFLCPFLPLFVPKMSLTYTKLIKIICMEKKGKSLRVKEPNLLIEAKQKMTREELLVWLWCLVNAKFISDRDGNPLTLEQVDQLRKRKEIFFASSYVSLSELKQRFPDYFSKDKIKYFQKILKGLEKKIVFEVNYELYKQTLEELGFEYFLEKLLKRTNPTKYFGIATIMAVALGENNDLLVVYTPFVAPLLVLLKKWFTIHNFEEVLFLERKPSIVLYRLFKEKLGLKRSEFELDIQNLADLFDLKKIDVRNLRRKYIEPAVKEINEKTRLKVEAEPVRRGRGGKIVGFRFRVEEEPRLEEATTKDLVENFDVLKKWFKKTIEQLAEELSLHKQVSPAEIAQSLLSLERINPAVAIWFLLHYPKSEAKLYALEHIKWVDNHRKLELPERYLKHAIQTPKKELQFLWDQRVKHAAISILEELKKEWEEKQEQEPKEPEPKETESEQEEIEIRNPVVGILAREILSEVENLSEEEKQDLKQELGVDSFRDYLKKLILTGDIANLQKVRVAIQKVKSKRKKSAWDEDEDPFDFM